MTTPTPTPLDAETLLDVYYALAGDESRLCRKRALLAVRDHVLAHARPWGLKAGVDGLRELGRIVELMLTREVAALRGRAS